MNNIEKRIHLDSIINALIWNEIPFEYDARELVIKLKGIDMTDALLAIHDYNDEKMTDLYKEINYLSEQIQELKIELDTPESVILDKLDEAKDLLKRFIETNEPVYFDEDRERFRKLKIETEQFLRSE